MQCSQCSTFTDEETPQLRKLSWRLQISTSKSQQDESYSERPPSHPRSSSVQAARLRARLVWSRQHSQRQCSVQGDAVASAGQGIRSRSRSQGLHLVFGCTSASVDIIFVHGLEGGAFSTWSHKGDVKNFWPKWLAQDDCLLSSRVFTFGYYSKIEGGDTKLNTCDEC